MFFEVRHRDLSKTEVSEKNATPQGKPVPYCLCHPDDHALSTHLRCGWILDATLCPPVVFSSRHTRYLLVGLRACDAQKGEKVNRCETVNLMQPNGCFLQLLACFIFETEPCSQHVRSTWSGPSMQRCSDMTLLSHTFMRWSLHTRRTSSRRGANHLNNKCICDYIHFLWEIWVWVPFNYSN